MQCASSIAISDRRVPCSRSANPDNAARSGVMYRRSSPPARAAAITAPGSSVSPDSAAARTPLAVSART